MDLNKLTMIGAIIVSSIFVIGAIIAMITNNPFGGVGFGVGGALIYLATTAMTIQKS